MKLLKKFHFPEKILWSVVSFPFGGEAIGRPAPNNLQSNRRVSAVARRKLSE